MYRIEITHRVRAAYNSPLATPNAPTTTMGQPSVHSIAQPLALVDEQGSAKVGGQELKCLIEKALPKADKPAQPKSAANERDSPTHEEIHAGLGYFAALAQRRRS